MASLDQHKADCIRFLGRDFEVIHRWLDECFAQFGPYHRKARHHLEGIQEVGERFGKESEVAALVHILRDCRHVPSRNDYRLGRVDALGLKKNWSTAAYIRYTNEDFEDLVSEHLKPSGLILWAFLNWDDARNFLSSLTRYTEEEVASLEDSWKESRKRLESTHLSITSTGVFTPASEITDLADDVRQYLNGVLEKALESTPAGSTSSAIVGYISIDSLTNPFVYIDYEFLEDLKPELAGTSALDIARFALPDKVTAPITAVGEPTQRTVTFVSRQKTMTVSNVKLRSTPEGTEVSYLITANSTGVVVSDAGDRVLLRNGIHRAYLLAQLGIREIPCVYIKDKNNMPVVTSSYPTFTPAVLVQSRQPMLTDFLRPELCLQAPMQRTHRVIRISADEAMIPVS